DEAEVLRIVLSVDCRVIVSSSTRRRMGGVSSVEILVTRQIGARKEWCASTVKKLGTRATFVKSRERQEEKCLPWMVEMWRLII
ncbi:hypothetical protein A2U01_0084125, partial [Trifolium medium]|nr:hypothetical protein [Trifolium medium]